MLSSYLAPKHQSDPEYFHYSPERIFRLCQNITPYVSLHHDHSPLPHAELFVTLRKSPCDMETKQLRK
jgi:hypothetical protein